VALEEGEVLVIEPRFIILTASDEDDVAKRANELSDKYDLYGELVVVGDGHDGDGYIKRRYYQWMQLRDTEWAR
jgi:hypothetical protein